jgi:hypothetical protein
MVCFIAAEMTKVEGIVYAMTRSDLICMGSQMKPLPWHEPKNNNLSVETYMEGAYLILDPENGVLSQGSKEAEAAQDSASEAIAQTRSTEVPIGIA